MISEIFYILVPNSNNNNNIVNWYISFIGHGIVTNKKLINQFCNNRAIVYSCVYSWVMFCYEQLQSNQLYIGRYRGRWGKDSWGLCHSKLAPLSIYTCPDSWSLHFIPTSCKYLFKCGGHKCRKTFFLCFYWGKYKPHQPIPKFIHIYLAFQQIISCNINMKNLSLIESY